LYKSRFRIYARVGLGFLEYERGCGGVMDILVSILSVGISFLGLILSIFIQMGGGSIIVSAISLIIEKFYSGKILIIDSSKDKDFVKMN
jgi:hypothetical protein